MKNYRYVLFDLDGTLTESGEGIINSAVYALKKFGIEPEMSTMTKFLGPPLKDSFRDFYGFDDEKCEQAVNTTVNTTPPRAFSRTVFMTALKNVLKSCQRLGFTLRWRLLSRRSLR